MKVFAKDYFIKCEQTAFRIHLWYLAKTWMTFLLIESLNNFRTDINSRPNWHSLKNLSWCTIKQVPKFNKVVTKWIIFVFYHIRCVARVGTIYTILKKWQNTHGGMLLLVKLQALARFARFGAICAI